MTARPSTVFVTTTWILLGEWTYTAVQLQNIVEFNRGFCDVPTLLTPAQTGT